MDSEKGSSSSAAPAAPAAAAAPPPPPASKRRPRPVIKKRQRQLFMGKSIKDLLNARKDVQPTTEKKIKKRKRRKQYENTLDGMFIKCFENQKQIQFKVGDGVTLILKGKKIKVLDRNVLEKMYVAETKKQWKFGAGGVEMSFRLPFDIGEDDVRSIALAIDKSLAQELNEDENFKKNITSPMFTEKRKSKLPREMQELISRLEEEKNRLEEREKVASLKPQEKEELNGIHNQILKLMIKRFEQLEQEKDSETIKKTFTAKQRAYFPIKFALEKDRTGPPKQVKPQRINEKDVEGLKCLRLGDEELGEFEQIDLRYEVDTQIMKMREMRGGQMDDTQIIKKARKDIVDSYKLNYSEFTGFRGYGGPKTGAGMGKNDYEHALTFYELLLFGGGVHRELVGNAISVFTSGRHMTTEEYNDWEAKLTARAHADDETRYDSSFFFNLDPWKLILLDLMFENKNNQIKFLRNLLSINFYSVMLSEPDLNRMRSNLSFLKYDNGKFSPSMTKLSKFFDIVKKECISKSGTDDSYEKLQNLKKTQQALEEGEKSGHYPPGEASGINGGKGFDRCGAFASFDCPIHNCKLEMKKPVAEGDKYLAILAENIILIGKENNLPVREVIEVLKEPCKTQAEEGVLLQDIETIFEPGAAANSSTSSSTNSPDRLKELILNKCFLDRPFSSDERSVTDKMPIGVYHLCNCEIKILQDTNSTELLKIHEGEEEKMTGLATVPPLRYRMYKKKYDEALKLDEKEDMSSNAHKGKTRKVESEIREYFTKSNKGRDRIFDSKIALNNAQYYLQEVICHMLNEFKYERLFWNMFDLTFFCEDKSNKGTESKGNKKKRPEQGAMVLKAVAIESTPQPHARFVQQETQMLDRIMSDDDVDEEEGASAAAEDAGEEEDIAKQYLLKYINEKLKEKISKFNVQIFNNRPEYIEAFEQLKLVFKKIGWINTPSNQPTYSSSSSSSSGTNLGGGNKYKSIKKRKTRRRRNKPNKKTRRRRK